MSGGFESWTPEQAAGAKKELELTEEEKVSYKILSEKSNLSREESNKLFRFQNKIKKLDLIKFWFPD